MNDLNMILRAASASKTRKKEKTKRYKTVNWAISLAKRWNTIIGILTFS